MVVGQRVARAGSATLLLLCTSGCTEFLPPTTRLECADAARDVGGGSDDASSGWMVAYSRKSHPLGSSGALYLCTLDLEATVSIDAPTGIAVDPNPLTVGADSDQVETVLVTVSGGKGDSLAAEFDGATIVVAVEVDGDEWSFGEQYGG